MWLVEWHIMSHSLLYMSFHVQNAQGFPQTHTHTSMDRYSPCKCAMTILENTEWKRLTHALHTYRLSYKDLHLKMLYIHLDPYNKNPNDSMAISFEGFKCIANFHKYTFCYVGCGFWNNSLSPSTRQNWMTGTGSVSPLCQCYFATYTHLSFFLIISVSFYYFYWKNGCQGNYMAFIRLRSLYVLYSRKSSNKYVLGKLKNPMLKAFKKWSSLHN